MKLFTAAWCQPCKQLKKWIASQGIEGIEIIDIDSEDEDVIHIIKSANIRGIPALQLPNCDVITTNEIIRPYLTSNVES